MILAEAGPGRGTLMADALRAVRAVAPGFAAALRLHLLETSPRLRGLQAARLPGATWHAGIEDLPAGPLLLLANEFLDALPIRQFVRRGANWVERHVEDGSFVEIACPAPTREVPDGGVPDGGVVERCEPALSFAAWLGRRLAQAAGAALLLDYGPEASAPGDSLQALARGRPADPLAEPGGADLTAHVDFQAIAEAARAAGAAVQGPLPQGVFLTRLGLYRRTDRLARAQPPQRAASLIAAAQRLAEPDRMGHLFKAMALCSPALPSLPGFGA